MLDWDETNLPELSFNDSKNRKNQARRLTGTKNLIEERRKKVYLLDLQGYSNQEIAKIVGVHLSTIEKDQNSMRYYCLKWSDAIRTMSRSTPISESCYEIEIVQKELWKMFRGEKNQSQKKKILDSIISNSIRKSSMFKEKWWATIDEMDEKKELEEQIEKDL